MTHNEFDTLFTVEAATETRSGIDVVKTWASAGTRWGKIEGLNTRELFESLQVHQNATMRVTLREEFTGLTTKHRLVNGTRTFYITAVVGEYVRNPRRGQTVYVTEDAP